LAYLGLASLLLINGNNEDNPELKFLESKIEPNEINAEAAGGSRTRRNNGTN